MACTCTKLAYEFVCFVREVELMMVDEDVEEGARDLLELNDEGNYSVTRKRGRGTKNSQYSIYSGASE